MLTELEGPFVQPARRRSRGKLSLDSTNQQSARLLLASSCITLTYIQRAHDVGREHCAGHNRHMLSENIDVGDLDTKMPESTYADVVKSMLSWRTPDCSREKELSSELLS